MAIVIITGSGGLIGSEAACYFAKKGFAILGIDNDSRAYFFGKSASTSERVKSLKNNLPGYTHFHIDVRNRNEIKKIFSKAKKEIRLVIHTAAQPSHDWAAREPFTDFEINATGTLNLLESFRQYCPDAVFIYTSTNKVYGDLPNYLPLEETPTRWELNENHKFFGGIDESMSIDQSIHSLFGVSKASADLAVQEYGRYFGLKTACFRGGCLTGPNHSGAQLHGFLSYLVFCGITNTPYTIFGYKGKQVRDNIHSYDLITAFDEFFQCPRIGEVYNIGGGRYSNCSVLEAIKICETVTGDKFNYMISGEARIGDHQWYISDLKKFECHFPNWKLTIDIPMIIKSIFEINQTRWKRTSSAA